MPLNIPKEALRCLKKLLGKRLLTSQEELEAYSYDASNFSFKPHAVALPENKEEVLTILELANKYEFYLISRGSGTSTTGSSLPILGGLVISFTRMNRILELNPEERIVRVEPGVLNGDLKNYLRRFNLFYPPDPASFNFSTIGGNVATGAGGPRGLKYGTTKDYILALEVGLPGGKLLKTGTHTLKGVVPYNLTPLFIGSEGTLGLFLEIVLKVIPLPERRNLFLIYFSSEFDALDFLKEILLMGITPATAEFIDKTSFCALSDHLEKIKAKDFIKNEIESLLFVEIDGNRFELEETRDIIIEFLKTRKLEYLFKEEEREIERIWEIRRNLSPSLKKLAPKKISDDVVVPRSKMKDFLFFLRDLEKKFKIYISAFGHIGDGNFHVNILHQEGEDTFALKIREAILRKVLELGGTLSGEHGVGYSKLPYVIWELSPVQIELMKGIKKVFDPKGILNPHIKVPEMSFFSK